MERLVDIIAVWLLINRFSMNEIEHASWISNFADNEWRAGIYLKMPEWIPSGVDGKLIIEASLAEQWNLELVVGTWLKCASNHTALKELVIWQNDKEYGYYLIDHALIL